MFSIRKNKKIIQEIFNVDIHEYKNACHTKMYEFHEYPIGCVGEPILYSIRAILPSPFRIVML